MFLTTALLLFPALNARAADVASGRDAKSAFERLKGLVGEWEGHVVTSDGQPPTTIRYEATSAGSVVMERLRIGADTEMVSMFHLDGKDLVLTHYCAAGNQPHLRWNPAKSTATELAFDFVRGGNMDPAVDGHMHSGRMLLKNGAHLENVWIGWEGGKPAGEKRFIVTRKKP